VHPCRKCPCVHANPSFPRCFWPFGAKSGDRTAQRFVHKGLWTFWPKVLPRIDFLSKNTRETRIFGLLGQIWHENRQITWKEAFAVTPLFSSSKVVWLPSSNYCRFLVMLSLNGGIVAYPWLRGIPIQIRSDRTNVHNNLSRKKKSALLQASTPFLAPKGPKGPQRFVHKPLCIGPSIPCMKSSNLPIFSLFLSSGSVLACTQVSWVHPCRKCPCVHANPSFPRCFWPFGAKRSTKVCAQTFVHCSVHCVPLVPSIGPMK